MMKIYVNSCDGESSVTEEEIDNPRTISFTLVIGAYLLIEIITNATRVPTIYKFACSNLYIYCYL